MSEHPPPGGHGGVPTLDPNALLERLRRHVASQWPGASVQKLRALEGGISSVTYAATLRSTEGERGIVVKVAPPGLAPVRERDVLRQAGVLRVLADLEGFPVPRVLFEDPGDPPQVPPLFAMERLPGEAYQPLIDVADSPPAPGVGAARTLVAARALATLHSVSPETLGVSGERVSEVVEELERWRRLSLSVGESAAPGHERLYERLSAAAPACVTPRLLHGDFRLANMLFTGVRLQGVIDWEIWSVGDPRFDLAWLLMYSDPAHVFHDVRPRADVRADEGMPRRAELVRAYREARRSAGAGEREIAEDTHALRWFLGVCYYKTASTLSVICKRNVRRGVPDPQLLVASRHLGDVVRAGHAALDVPDLDVPDLSGPDDE